MAGWKRSISLHASGHAVLASPDDAPLRWLHLTLDVLEAGARTVREAGPFEVVLDLLEGRLRLLREGDEWCVLERESFFDQPPVFVCIPRDGNYAFVAERPSILLSVSAPVPAPGPWAVVSPEDAPARVVGRENWVRTLWPGTSELPVTQRLLVGETQNPPGGWSSFPPHKHDTEAPPQELPYEEVYYFRFDPPTGFGLQRIYGSDRDGHPFDDVYVVQDGDTIVIPKGYHPVVAAPGYRMGYVWALCGEGKQYGAWTVDPVHRWILEETRP